MSGAEFLLACIAEDEAVAHCAAKFHPPPWHRDPEVQTTMEAGRWLADANDEGVLVANGDTAARHIARHDPARVLAECAAKRAMIEMHRPEERITGYRGGKPIVEWLCRSCGGSVLDEDAGGNRFLDIYKDSAPCDTLLALAQPYADHPDFRPEWR